MRPSFILPLLLLPFLTTAHLLSPPNRSTSPSTPSHPSTLTAKTSLSQFNHFTHPSFPKHQIRIKRTDGWCETRQGVRGWTGYVDTGERSLFFYFFESRSNPAEDPVLFWINGGPGASSAYGLFVENGPCRITPEGTLVDNPDSWNQATNLFFLDQPAGVGFSYGHHGVPTHSRTELAALDVQAFVTIFFENFSEFKNREFHMAAESYGGRYLPVFASAVLDGNALAEERGVAPINLKSVLIGNGWTDTVTMMEGYVQQQCTAESGVYPVQSIKNCVALRKALPFCTENLIKECRIRFDAVACAAAVDFCENTIIGAFRALPVPVSWYDISEECTDEMPCKSDSLTKALTEYLNKNSTQEILGIDEKWQGPWSMSSAEVARSFGGIAGVNSDLHDPTYYYVAGLLERGVRALIYAGKVDFACNFIGVRGWLDKLEWTGAKEYQDAPYRYWAVPGSEEIAGEIKTAGNGLAFATVRGAGHLVPFAKPKESLHMLMNWINDKEI